MAGLKKQICLRGHDTSIVGRSLSHTCNQCKKDYRDQYNKTPKAQTLFRESSWRKVGILNDANEPFTEIDYDRLYQLQSGKCKICSRHQSEIIKRFHVDHDHTTGIVRALLCSSCNQALGLIKENVTILKSMITFLERC